MIGVQTMIETLQTIVPNVVVLVANTAKDVLPSREGSGEQFTYRSIQNLTGADLYVAVDITADNANNYHVVLADRQTFNCITNGRVSCFSVGGGKVSTLEHRRRINTDAVPVPSDA